MVVSKLHCTALHKCNIKYLNLFVYIALSSIKKAKEEESRPAETLANNKSSVYITGLSWVSIFPYIECHVILLVTQVLCDVFVL